MEIVLQFFSPVNSLLGFSYRKGRALNKQNKEVIFHEFSIGIILGSLTLTWY